MIEIFDIYNSNCFVGNDFKESCEDCGVGVLEWCGIFIV